MTMRKYYEQRKQIIQIRAKGQTAGKKNIEKELTKCSNDKVRKGAQVLKITTLFRLSHYWTYHNKPVLQNAEEESVSHMHEKSFFASFS